MTATGRTEDRADESIVLSNFAERAIHNGIEKMSKFDTIRLRVALKNTPGRTPSRSLSSGLHREPFSNSLPNLLHTLL